MKEPPGRATGLGDGRLALDAGVHAKRGTREQTVAYFHGNANESEPDALSGTDRCIANPGRVLG